MSEEQVVFIDRRNTDCAKWDNLEAMFGEGDLQAMWVADMDFKAPQCVLQAQQAYVAMGAQGYYKVPEGYYDAFIAWEAERHGYAVSREHIRFSPGVVAALNWFVQLMTAPGDAVIVLTPVYYPFLNAVKDNGRKLVMCDLIKRNGRYTVDLAAFRRDIVENNVRAFILSSPHNPVGRVWTREELKGMLDICKELGVFVISDEIHHDIVFAPAKHIPSATVGAYDANLVTLTAPSKTFNLAACQNSFVIIPDAEIRRRFDDYTSKLCVRSGNPFGCNVAEAAYRHGLPWLEEVLAIIEGNARAVRETLSERLPKVAIAPLEGTYLLWLDFGAYLAPGEVKDFMQKKCRLAFDYGDWFGGERFGACVRMNLATSRELVDAAVARIVENLSAKA